MTSPSDSMFDAVSLLAETDRLLASVRARVDPDQAVYTLALAVQTPLLAVLKDLNARLTALEAARSPEPPKSLADMHNDFARRVLGDNAPRDMLIETSLAPLPPSAPTPGAPQWAFDRTFEISSLGPGGLSRSEVAVLLCTIRREALEEAARAVDDEHLEDAAVDDDLDTAYDEAINDAYRAVLDLRDKDPS